MKYLYLFLFLTITICVSAQKNVIDKIVAIVGEEIILKSDIENIRSQGYLSSGGGGDERIQILEELLVQKLLLAQAKVDSVFITDENVDRALDNRMAEYLRHFGGSVERMIASIGKPIEEFRAEMAEPIRQHLIVEDMQYKIVEHIRVTPSEVRNFYHKINKDSLMDEPDKYEIQQIVVKPVITATERERVRNLLREYREKAISGEQSFSTLAILYSEDNTTSALGGETGFQSKNDFLPEFAEAAFSLKPERISKIVETEDGFHILQYLDRQGERVNVRHILLRPRIEEASRIGAMATLDTILNFINEEATDFGLVAQYRSEDKKTRNNGGLIINYAAESKLSRDEISPDIMRQLNRLQVGEISAPFLDKKGDVEEYKIIKYKAFYPTHKANLEEDWLLFEDALLKQKQNEAIMKWIKERKGNTYIHIDEYYRSELLVKSGWIK